MSTVERSTAYASVFGADKSGRSSLIHSVLGSLDQLSLSIDLNSVSNNARKIELIEYAIDDLPTTLYKRTSTVERRKQVPTELPFVYVITLDLSDLFNSESTLNTISSAVGIAPNIRLIIVGTKCDLPQRISDLHIERLLTHNPNLQYFETSVHENVGINQLACLLTSILNSQQENNSKQQQQSHEVQNNDEVITAMTPKSKQDDIASNQFYHRAWTQMCTNNKNSNEGDSSKKKEDEFANLSSILMSDRHSASVSSDVIGFLNEYQNLKQSSSSNAFSHPIYSFNSQNFDNAPDAAVPMQSHLEPSNRMNFPKKKLEQELLTEENEEEEDDDDDDVYDSDDNHNYYQYDNEQNQQKQEEEEPAQKKNRYGTSNFDRRQSDFSHQNQEMSSLSMFERKYIDSQLSNDVGDDEILHSSRFNQRNSTSNNIEQSIQIQSSIYQPSNSLNSSRRIPAGPVDKSSSLISNFGEHLHESSFSEDCGSVLASQDLNCLKAGKSPQYQKQTYSTGGFIENTRSQQQQQQLNNFQEITPVKDSKVTVKVATEITIPSHLGTDSNAKSLVKQQLSEVNSFQRKKNVNFVMNFCVELRGKTFFLDVMQDDDAYSLVNKFAVISGIQPNIAQIKALAIRFQEYIQIYADNLSTHMEKTKQLQPGNEGASKSKGKMNTTTNMHPRDFLQGIPQSICASESNQGKENDCASIVGYPDSALSFSKIKMQNSISMSNNHQQLLTSKIIEGKSCKGQQVQKQQNGKAKSPLKSTAEIPGTKAIEERISEFKEQQQGVLPIWMTSYRVLPNETIVVQLALGPTTLSIRVDKRDQISAVLMRCSQAYKIPNHIVKDLTNFFEKARLIFKAK